MKKFLLLTTFLIAFFNCSNDLEFNEHAFQATKDNEFWKAKDFSIKIDENGFLNLTGVFENEIVGFNIESSDLGVYSLGTHSNSTAWYVDGKEQGYTTEYRRDGEIVIEKYDPALQTFSGSFRFNAFSSDGKSVNFMNGVFYQVPIVNETEIDDEGELKASVDESELEAEEVDVLYENGMIEVQGVGGDGSFIKLYIPDTTTVGSYNLNEQSDSGTYAIYGYASGNTSTAQYGTLFINEHDSVSGIIKGSFTFTTLLPNSVSVENGSFTAYY